MKREDVQERGTALRGARYEHMLARLHRQPGHRRTSSRSCDGVAVERETYAPNGAGCVRLGDAWLAERAAREARRIACEELRIGPLGRREGVRPIHHLRGVL